MTVIGSGMTQMLKNFYTRLIPRQLSYFKYYRLNSSLLWSYIPTIIISNAGSKSALHISHYTNFQFANKQPNSFKRKLLNNTTFYEFYQHTRGYAMRLELTEYGIIWRRPEQVPSWKPEKAGDLVPFEEIDKTKSTLSFLSVEKELVEVDEHAQRLLSLEFSSDKEVLKMVKYRMKRRVQQHQFDEDSLEVKIASMTAEIRYLQKVVSEVKSKKKMLRKRVKLQEMVAKRKKMLKIMRRLDYKRFEWLLEELQIIYRPFPRIHEKVTRRGSIRKLVALHCEHIRNMKLEKYRLHLETLKKPFLEEKRQTVKWIAETERKLGLPVSVEVLEEEDEHRSGLLQLEGSTCQSSDEESRV